MRRKGGDLRDQKYTGGGSRKGKRGIEKRPQITGRGREAVEILIIVSRVGRVRRKMKGLLTLKFKSKG